MSIIFGQDSSGNNNNWNAFNFSANPGFDNDSMVDSPTNFGGDEVDSGGEVKGNYAVLMPGIGSILSKNNLRVFTAAGESNVASSLVMTTGKWYFEAVATALPTTGAAVGIVPTRDYQSDRNMYEGTNRGYGYYGGDGSIFLSGTNVSYGASWTVNDIIGCAFDADAGTLQFFKNGVSQGIFSGVVNQEYRFSVGEGQATGSPNTGAFNVNFGQLPFAYTPPAGFKSLNTKNLNEQHPFVSGPDLVWTKSRSFVNNHHIFDSVRGPALSLKSSSTAAEDVRSTTLQSFNSNGFTLGSGPDVNQAGSAFVAWCWNAGSRTVGNQDGTITSTVRANPEAGFSIVTYTGTGVSGSTIGHGLNNAPKFIITKRVNSTSNWWVYSDAQDRLYPGQWQYLNLNFSTQNTANASDAPYFKTKPTSSVFSIAGDGINTNGGTYVSYLWSEVEGYSKFGTYTGNGSVDGPFIYTGFRPAFVIQKRVATTGDNWIMSDSKRGNSNFIDEFLNPNRDIVESNNNITGGIDYLSNGFKCRHTNGSINASGGTYIYMAFAEQPFKHALAR